jgi:hypothetical protein
LTFNATLPIVLEALKVGLVVHQPLRPVPQPLMIRGILCPPEVDERLSGKDPSYGLPASGIAITIGRFIRGHSMGVSRKKRPRRWRGPEVELEQLEGFDEVWVLCYRHPRPGWRLLGRFLSQDTLAVFRVKDKLDIGSDYSAAVGEVISDWNAYFGAKRPLSGTELEVYLSGAHRNVDK